MKYETLQKSDVHMSSLALLAVDCVPWNRKKEEEYSSGGVGKES